MSMVIEPNPLADDRPAAAADLPAPPSALRVMGILARISWRRLRNQLALGGSAFARKKPEGEAPAPRQATPGKQNKLGPIIAVVICCLWFGPAMLAVGCLFGAMFVERLGNRLHPRPQAATTAPAQDGKGP